MLHGRLKNIGKESELVVLTGAFHGQMVFAEQFMGLRAFKHSTRVCDDYYTTIGRYI